MDPHNHQALVDPKIDQYWKNVDLYVGGTEHATGHLIYSRFWNKFLYDMGVSVMEAHLFHLFTVSQAHLVACPNGGSPVSVGRNLATSGSSSGRLASSII